MIQCVYPWSSLSIRPDNQCGLCFASHKTYYQLNSDTTLNDIHNHPDRLKHRESMLNNTSVDDGFCERCCEYQCCNQTSLNNRIKEQGLLPIYKEIQDNKIYIENPPEEIDVCIDNVCDYDCEMCYNKKIKFKISDSFLNILSQINDKSNHNFRVVWIGGELFASRFSKELLLKAMYDNDKMTLCILTNGSTFNEDLLNKCKIDSVTISIDSYLKDTYEKIRKNGNFENVLNNVSRYILYRQSINATFDITITCVITKQNYNQINDIINFYSYNYSGINLHFRYGMIRNSIIDIFYESRADRFLFKQFANNIESALKNINIQKFNKPYITTDSLNSVLRHLYDYQIKEHGKDRMDELWL